MIYYNIRSDKLSESWYLHRTLSVKHYFRYDGKRYKHCTDTISYNKVKMKMDII